MKFIVPLAVLLVVLPIPMDAQSDAAKAGSKRASKAAPLPKAASRKPVRVRARSKASTHAHVTTVSGKSRSVRVRRIPPVVYSREVQGQAFDFVVARFALQPNDFENADALGPFFQRLSEAQRENRPIHVLQYGDSHTASDDWVDAMRKVFQENWGDGGPGFTAAGHPYKGYRRFDVSGTSSLGWKTEGTVSSPGDERNGLAGVSITAQRPGETVTLKTSGDRLEMLFLKQPGGGAFTISCDGAVIGSAETDGALETGTYTISTTPGEHTYSLSTTSSAPVRLFGWVSENDHGVTFETLGINGARASMLRDWDQELWREQLQARDPGLVIMAYGTNEALSPLFDPVLYRADLLAAVSAIQQAVPNAAILLVGPPDCDRRRPFPYLQQVIEIQSEVAAQMKCAFWNWASHMDESGGRARWVQAGLSQADFTHLTGKGYQILGQKLAQELVLEYRRSAQPETPSDSVPTRVPIS